MTGGLRRRFGTALLGRVVGAVLQTVIIALLARSLGVPGFAEFAVVVGATQAIASATDLGFGLRVLQLATDDDRRRVIGSLLVFRALTIALIIVATLLRSALDGRVEIASVALFAFYAVGEMLGDLTLAIWQGELKSGLASGGLVFRRVVALAPLALTGDSTGVRLALLSAGVLGCVMFIFTTARRTGRPFRMREILKQNGSLTLLTSSFGIQSSDTVLVGLSGSASLTAYYGAASRLANPINLAISTLTQVLIPTFRTLSESDRLVALRRARGPILVLAGATGCVAFASPFVVDVLYGPSFAGAAPIVAAVFVGAALSAIAQLHLAYLVSSTLPLLFGVEVLCAVLVGLTTIGILAALSGAVGASVGFVLSQAMILLVIFWAFLRETRVPGA